MMSSSVVNASYAHAPQGAAPSAHAAWPSPSSGHHAETRHPGTADAAQRQARVGLRERARTHSRTNAPQPRSIAWGEVQEKRRRTLLVRVFWKGSGNGSSDVVISPPEAGGCCPPRCPRKWCPNSAQTCAPSSAARRRREIDRQLALPGQWSNYRQQFRATSKVRGAPPPA